VARAATSEGRIAFRDGETWFRITGELGDGPTPLVCLHGGPGAAHDYLESLSELAGDGRAVIHYDQIGCGRSTRFPDRGSEFYSVQLFLDELETLLAHFEIESGYHLLGQSWGGMLAAEHALRHPRGLRSLVISNSPASMELWVSEARRLRAALPTDVQDALNRHEADETYGAPEYLAATQVFYDRHVCRVVPNPEEVQRSFAQLIENPTVYLVMNGPTEFHCIGSLRPWSVVDAVSSIGVPTLVLSGRHDEATPATVRPFAEGIPGARWEIFEDSSHMPFVEEPERYRSVVSAFLAEHD
jgi:L-proline amide hydrolase